MADLDGRIEKLCTIVLMRSGPNQSDIRRNDEFWEQRNRAVIDLTSLMNELKGKFNCTSGISRLLKDPIKSLISDQRSQQIRDTCTFLTTLAEKCGDSLKGLLREIFPSVLETMKQPNKVVSGYVDECIIFLIRNVTFKSCIPVIGESTNFPGCN